VATTLRRPRLAAGKVEGAISFQGRLIDDIGDPLPDGTCTLDFFCSGLEAPRY
jgi:hypothetical protein